MRFNEFRIKEDPWTDMVNQTFGDFGGIKSPTAPDSATPGGAPDSATPGGAPGGTINFKSSAGQINPNDIKKYLLSKGLDNNQAAGLLVNIKWESHFKPGAYVHSDNHQGPSGGLFGFHDPKFDGRGNFSDMVAYCGGGDKWQTEWQKQLDFALSKDVGKSYMSQKFSSPGDAAAWWVINYEKPADTQGQAIARAKDARQYA
jgi:Phage tail lysozyme